MKGCWKNGGPAFLAILIFFAVEMIHMFANIPQQQWYNFEVMSNVLMIMVSLFGLFYWGLPSKENTNGNLGSVLGNLMVPAIAFSMNIDVFEHTIRLEKWQEALWGWHLWWTACAVMQILVLTRAGKNLLSLAQTMITVVKNMGIFFVNTVSIIPEEIKKSNKVIAAGVILWAGYIGFQFYSRGIDAVLSDIDVIWMSVWGWMAYLTIYILASNAPLFCKKIREALLNLNGKKALAALVAIIFVISMNKLPSLLKTIAIIILIPIVGISILVFLIIGIIKTGKFLKRLNFKITGLERKGAVTGDINWGDLKVLLCSFLVIPLMVVYVLTLIRLNEIQGITDWDPKEAASWLNFANTAVEVCKSLLDLFIWNN